MNVMSVKLVLVLPQETILFYVNTRTFAYKKSFTIF